MAFISQTAPFSSAAAAPGTDPECALSPGAPRLLSYPCSGQAPLLRPFLLRGFHALPRRTQIQGDSYFPIPGAGVQKKKKPRKKKNKNKNPKHSNALYCFKNKEHFKCIQRQASTRSKLDASYHTQYSLLWDCYRKLVVREPLKKKNPSAKRMQ